jgi:hypothetical protein
MALTADLDRTAVSADGIESTWEDNTVYGGANPDRNEVAVYLTAYKVDEDLEETELDVETFDPETADEFTTTNGDDGWHKYYFVIVDNWLVGTTYTKYDLVWSTSQNAFYEYINDTDTAGNLVTNTTYWLVVADPTTKIENVGTDEESGNLIYQVVNKVLDFQTSICYIKAASQFAKEVCDNSGECACDTRLGKQFTKIRNLFASLPLNESTGKYLEGEKNARLAEKYCDDCGCLS